MTDLLVLIAAVASLWLTGVALTALCLRRGADEAALPAAELHGLALLLGVGGLAWLQFCWSLCGGRLGTGLSVGMSAVGSICGLWALVRRRQRRILAQTPPHVGTTRLAPALLLLVWTSLLVQTLLTPQRFWDERAIFGIKAAVLFEEGSIQSRDWAHPDFAQGHPRYPLLLPLAEQHIYAWLGRVDDRWSKLVPALLALGLWLTFCGVLSRRVGSASAWLWTLVLATVPALTCWELGFLSAQADAPVAAFHGASVLYLWDSLSDHAGSRSSPVAGGAIRSLWAAGLLAGFALFTKDEGIALALVDVGALALLGLVEVVRRRTIQPTIAALGKFLLPMILLAAPWFWHRRSLPVTTEMTYFDRLSPAALRAGWETLGWSLPHLWDRMFREAFTWGLTWWGVVGACLAAPRKLLTRPQAFLMCDLLGAVAALLVAGMLAPTAVADHLGGSTHRFLLQISPTAVLFLASQFAPAGHRAASVSAPEAAP